MASLLLVILSVFLFEAHARRTRNPTPVTQGDQESYLRYARRMQESNYRYIGGRNRMPIYPFLLSLIYRPGMSEDEFLRKAQAFNVNLSAAILLALFLVWRRFFPALFAFALVAATAFGVFLTRAVLAQVEVLFYFVFFGLFLVFCRMLRAPNLWLAAGTGVLAGLTFLLKASVLPALGLFVIIFVAKMIWQRQRDPRPLLLVFSLFLILIFPYIGTSKRIYGQYFYNVNSTFYFWCDSWPEARAFERAGRIHDGWPALPPEQIPSPGKYWREHSLAQIAGRLFGGMAELATHNARLDGYYKYVVLLVGTAAWLALRQRREFLVWLRARTFPAIFAALFFAGYFCLFAWYAPISADSRFLLTLFLPVTFVAVWVIMSFAPRFALNALPVILLVFATADAIHRLAQVVR